MNDIVAIFKIQDIDPLANDVEFIAEKHKQYETAKRAIFSMVSAKGGRPIGQVYGNEVVVVPIESSEVIKEIHQRLSEEYGIYATVGVGEDSEQAMIALDYADKHSPHSIRVYKEEYNAPKEQINPLDVAIGESDAISKSEKYIPVSEEDKQKIAKVLNSVRLNQQIFEQLKSQSPEVYSGLVSVIQSLSQMLKQDSMGKDDHIDTMVGKINKQLGNHQERKTNQEAKKIQREINKYVKNKDKEKKKHLDSLSEMALEKHKSRRKDAREYAKSLGHPNHEFFTKLLHTFRK